MLRGAAVSSVENVEDVDCGGVWELEQEQEQGLRESEEIFWVNMSDVAARYGTMHP